MPSHSVRLPDVMPEIEQPTLMVICDNHRCVLVDVGGHTLVREEVVESKQGVFTERKGLIGSPAAGGKGGGILSGTEDLNQMEWNRMRDFANVVVRRLTAIVREQGIREVYLSAPGKFLSVLKKHLSKELEKVIRTMLDGNFVKEQEQKVLLRFRPDLSEAVRRLKDDENYSARRQPPRKAR